MHKSLKKQDLARGPVGERRSDAGAEPARGLSADGASAGRQAAIDGSPRMAAQRSRLGALGHGASAPVVQGQFVYRHDGNDTIIDSRAAAKKLAVDLYGRRRADSKVEALVRLATKGDHGTLSQHALLAKINDERLEHFTLERKGRRLHTRQNPDASYPEDRSLTHRHLAEGQVNVRKRPRAKGDDGTDADTDEEAEAVGDFSYVDLNNILTQATTGMEPALVKAAAAMAVQNFEVMKLSVNVDMNPDVQLMVQHALQYQAFNHPQLKGRGKSGPNAEAREQNRFRTFELEKSKALLVQDAEGGFAHTLPPRPTEASSSEHAFSALLDVNRPLPNTPLDGATYKAVYLCTRAILHRAYASMGAKAPEPEHFFAQRLHFNDAFAQQLTEMDGSHLASKEDAAKYVQTTLGFPRFKTDAEESEDDASDTEEFKTHSDKMVVDEDENIFRNKPKMDLFTVGLGTYSKLSSQKALVDRLDTASRPAGKVRKSKSEDRDRRHAKRRKLIEARVSWAKDRHQEDFSVTRSEHAYYRKKLALIADMQAGLQQEYDEAADEDAQNAVWDQMARLEEVRMNLKSFYKETSVKALRERRTASTRWKARKESKPIFGPVGSAASLDAHVRD